MGWHGSRSCCPSEQPAQTFEVDVSTITSLFSSPKKVFVCLKTTKTPTDTFQGTKNFAQQASRKKSEGFQPPSHHPEKHDLFLLNKKIGASARCVGFPQLYDRGVESGQPSSVPPATGDPFAIFWRVQSVSRVFMSFLGCSRGFMSFEGVLMVF